MTETVTFLHHSGFSVLTENHYLIFDYDGIGPAPDESLINTMPTTIFISHRHGDHFSKKAVKLAEKHPSASIVASYDLPKLNNTVSAVMMKPHETKTVNGLTVETLDSTDEGVAFVVTADGVTIYHAGDLNYWHWNGESDAYNEDMRQKYLAEINRLKGRTINIAFVPVDPRLEDKYMLGIDNIMRTADIKAAFPMHFLNDFSIVEKLKSDPAAKDYADRVMGISHFGQQFIL
jgi:L-ascorbate metabolism protein UlaG (beta-lactamase superfamily)